MNNYYIRSVIVEAKPKIHCSQDGYEARYEGYENKVWIPKKLFKERFTKINGSLNPVNHMLLSKHYTYIIHDEPTYCAPHNYVIYNNNKRKPEDKSLLGVVHFQEGALKETKQNGIFNEDLIGIVIHRLECFQKSKYNCRENKLAIEKLEEALCFLRQRTEKRRNRGVLGRHEV